MIEYYKEGLSEDFCDQDDWVADKVFMDAVGSQTQIVGGNLVTNPTRTKGLLIKVNQIRSIRQAIQEV